MDKTVLVSCAVIVISFYLEVVLANQRFDTPAESKVRYEGEPKIPPSWFSPRLGRKKRNSKEEIYKPSEQELAELLEEYDESPLAFVALNGNDRLICKNVQSKRSNFIPRLGRNIDGDLNGNNKWLQDSDNSGEYLIQRSPPFAPRLGRRFIPYSQRLEMGREN